MEIALKDFPDEIYIKLKEDYKKKIINQLLKLKLEFLSKKLDISKTTIVEWRKRAEYFPLGKLKIILKLINRYNLGELENNIINYGTKKSKLFIKNPKLPIKDSPYLREIVIHIMCDGCYSKENGYAAYYNMPQKTKEEFVKELNRCFGELDIRIHKDHVHFPTTIPLILKRYLKIDFNSKKCRIPLEFFIGNRKELVAIIRASIIDEGTVDGSNVRIDSCNKKFLEDLKQICKKLNYKCGKTWMSKGPIFRFNILSESLKQLKKDLGDLPIEKKQLLIDLAEKNQRRGWKYRLPGEVKTQIIKELLKRPKRNIELILKLNYSKSALGKHLRWLIKRGLLSKKIENNITTYFIKDKENAIKFTKNPSDFIKSNKINNYGLSQIKLLELVNNEIMKYNKIEKSFGFCKSATFKLVLSLKKKGFIKKIGKRGWIITEKGKKVLLLDKEKARYYLYANIK